ncbi:acetoacetyl-CoA synthetase [Armillaria novae-zelandiae]|uniref:Acetoacetyl-CoA synthetase n=1 Tax=Armillaria novae-zelandiae TaxID=153914 RepID=A0AA39TAW1_9AGAR|nr:acetoacetyl-CoA synthetase [Armillaria novae-zelandiae]
MSSYFDQSRLVWNPLPRNCTEADAFRRFINRKHGFHLQNYHDLHKYSVEDYTFWLDLWEYVGIVSSLPPNKLEIISPGRIPEVPIWFPGARLNYAENLLIRNDDSIAITASGESGEVVDYTWKQLRSMVREMAAALRVNGLVVGDRVAAVVRNSATAIVLAIATASIGGIFSSTATDMGAEGVLGRYRQIQPKFFFTESEVFYAGKVVNLMSKVYAVVEDLQAHGLQRAILLPSGITGRELTAKAGSKLTKLSAFLATGDNRELTFEQLPFSQPLFILYSSGTSGPPKCIVHSAGGSLLTGKKDSYFGADLHFGQTLFQYTSTGWVMWTVMLTALSCGLRVICYDGSPLHPDLRTFLKFINDQNVTLFGTSPRFLSEIRMELAPFEALATILVTGAPLTPSLFRWTQEVFGSAVHLFSTSGGTDICGGFLTGSTCLPSYAGELKVKSLGMKVEVFDPDGNNIEHTSEPGELVCTRPHPTIPLFFWGDTRDDKKLRETYFSVWRQGDFVVINPKTKGAIILGRSDGVLNPSGVRFGSGEIYNVMGRFSSTVEDSLCIGQRRPKDLNERVLLFVKMRPGNSLSSVLIKDIRDSIRASLSPRHVPAYIFEVDDIPYTVNGKKIEIAVKQIVSGSNMKPSGTVANPDSLKLYYKYVNLEDLVNATSKL